METIEFHDCLRYLWGAIKVQLCIAGTNGKLSIFENEIATLVTKHPLGIRSTFTKRERKGKKRHLPRLIVRQISRIATQITRA